jgi:hypothetical protein
VMGKSSDCHAATAATPPSRAAMRFSKTSTVGYIILKRLEWTSRNHMLLLPNKGQNSRS